MAVAHVTGLASVAHRLQAQMRVQMLHQFCQRLSDMSESHRDRGNAELQPHHQIEQTIGDLDLLQIELPQQRPHQRQDTRSELTAEYIRR